MQSRRCLSELARRSRSPRRPYAQTCACAPEGGYVIQADEAPPPLPEYDQPPIPAPGYYWTPGYWAWNNYDYYWVPGSWVEPPQPGLLWTPGYWAFVGGAYAFRPGYWGPRVGFYGGIDYGFGYGGDGYQGGRWDNGHFFYNTSREQRRRRSHRQRLSSADRRQPDPQSRKLQRRTRRDGREANQRTTAGGEGAACPGDKAASQSGSRRGNEKRAVRVHEPGQAGGRRDRAPGAVQGQGRGSRQGRRQGGGSDARPKRRKNRLLSRSPLRQEPRPARQRPRRSRPAAETLAKPEAAPGAPKVEEKHAPAEKLAKPEAAPGRRRPRRSRSGREAGQARDRAEPLEDRGAAPSD